MNFVVSNQFLVGLFILSIALICAGCLLPAAWLPPIKHDKLIHFSSFAVLTLMANLLTNNAKDFIIWMSLLALLGFAIEILQKFIPGRGFCWKDFFSNIAGILSASLICNFF